MAFIGLMFAIFAGSALVRSMTRVTAITVARKTNSTGCGCLTMIVLLALVAIVVMLV